MLATSTPKGVPIPHRAHSIWSQLRWSASCAFFGHYVNDLTLSAEGPASCRCGTPFLAQDGGLTRVRHTLSCFLLGHTYRPLTERDGHREYLCAHCGHTMLFSPTQDPLANRQLVRKRVRYLCNLFGHRVHPVALRGPWAEYACGCGHVFLKEDSGAQQIKHPPACTAIGHFIQFVVQRHGQAEYVCVVCGHPFCFPLHP